MPTTTTASVPEPKRSRVTFLQDQVLARHRKELNKSTARRIYENETPDLIPRLKAAIAATGEAKQLLVVGEWGGADGNDPLHQALDDLRKEIGS
jgi:hypothetical protein